MTQRASCVTRSVNDHFIQIHQDDIDLCEGNATAAALLSFFEWWHNHNLVQQHKAHEANDTAEMHGEPRTQHESLWQWHTEAQMENGIKIASRKAITRALKWLEAQGYVTTGRNPNPRFAFDRTRFFLFHPDRINTALESLCRSRQMTLSSRQMASPSRLLTSPSRQKGAAIEKITREDSREDLKEKPGASACAESPVMECIPQQVVQEKCQEPSLPPRRIKTLFPTDPRAQDALRHTVITPSLHMWIDGRGLTTNLDDQWEAFGRKALANGYKYMDWRAAFQNWLTSDYQHPRVGRKATTPLSEARLAEIQAALAQAR